MHSALIFAAGLGTRLRPITDTMPKALVPVDGKPLIQLQLEKLRAAGFTRVVVNVHHFADMLENWCREHPMGMDISFSDERAMLLDTGGGVRHARPLLTGCDRFLLHNVDILSNLDLTAFFHRGTRGMAMLAVSSRSTQRYLLFDDDMRLVGWTNKATREVRSPYPDLNPSSCHQYAFAGIHQMSTQLFPLFDEWPEKFSIIDFYLKICAQYPIYGLHVPGLRLLDVGKLSSLEDATVFLRTM